jgi:UDP-N-acetylglucosamine 2-epimerase
MKVMTLLGTRPEIIRLSRVIGPPAPERAPR